MSAAPPGEPALQFGRLEGAAVALALALSALIAALPGDHPLAFASMSAMLAMLAWIAASDLRRWIVPDGPVIAVALLGAAWRLGPLPGTGAFPLSDLLFIAGDGLLWGGLFLLLRESYFRRRGVDGLGFGDVKLAGAAGILLGTSGFAWALLLASLGGLLAALAARALGRRIERIPFGAFLAPACGLIWLVGLKG